MLIEGLVEGLRIRVCVFFTLEPFFLPVDIQHIFFLLSARGHGPHTVVVEYRGNLAGTLRAALNPAVSTTGEKIKGTR